jgi:hypothetical protein
MAGRVHAGTLTLAVNALERRCVNRRQVVGQTGLEDPLACAQAGAAVSRSPTAPGSRTRGRPPTSSVEVRVYRSIRAATRRAARRPHDRCDRLQERGAFLAGDVGHRAGRFAAGKLEVPACERAPSSIQRPFESCRPSWRRNTPYSTPRSFSISLDPMWVVKPSFSNKSSPVAFVTRLPNPRVGQLARLN